jgi:rubrerythrin
MTSVTKGASVESRNPAGYGEFAAAGDAGIGEYRCSVCGYGVIVQAVLPRCPMCGGTSWERAARRR